MQRNAEKRVRRMWDEVSSDKLAPDMAMAIAEGLGNERMPRSNPAHKETVLAAIHAIAAERTSPVGASDRSFRVALDQGTTSAGTWRLFDTLRPQLALLPWTYWVLAGLLFGIGSFLLPFIGDWGPAALVVTVPLLGLMGFFFTLRTSNHRMREWEQSCPVTPFQLVLARIVIVLALTLVASFSGSLFLVRQEFGISFATLTVSWLAPLLFISGLYLVADAVVGGSAGSMAALVAWFGYCLLTQGGQVATTLALRADGFALSRLDTVGLTAGMALLVTGFAFSTSTRIRESHEHSSS